MCHGLPGCFGSASPGRSQTQLGRAPSSSADLQEMRDRSVGADVWLKRTLGEKQAYVSRAAWLLRFSVAGPLANSARKSAEQLCRSPGKSWSIGWGRRLAEAYFG